MRYNSESSPVGGSDANEYWNIARDQELHTPLIKNTGSEESIIDPLDRPSDIPGLSWREYWNSPMGRTRRREAVEEEEREIRGLGDSRRREFEDLE